MAATEHPPGRSCGSSCACAAEGGGGRHPALGRRLGVSGVVRSAGGAAASSAQGDDWSRLPRSGARKAQLRTQGGGDSRNFSTQPFAGLQSCLLLPLTAPVSGLALQDCLQRPSLDHCLGRPELTRVSSRWQSSGGFIAGRLAFWELCVQKDRCTRWGGRTFKVSRSQR